MTIDRNLFWAPGQRHAGLAVLVVDCRSVTAEFQRVVGEDGVDRSRDNL
jgi:hypothetical protein